MGQKVTETALVVAILDKGLTVICHDAKRIYKELDGMGVHWRGCAFDTMLAAYVLNAAEGSFDVALLEAEFTPDEAGRIRAMMIRREQLTQNTVEVFRSSVATLREERTKKSLAEGDIHSTLAYLRDKKRIHKGKVDTE